MESKTSNQTSQELMGRYHILTIESEAVAERINATRQPVTHRALIARQQEINSRRDGIMAELKSVGMDLQTQNIIDEMKEVERTQMYKGFTIAELRTMFDRIAHPVNWKLEIVALVKQEELDKARVAIEFFAGSPMTVPYIDPVGTALIKAPGYYKCVGA
jgi:hypothetical protein